jgi:hypothetical protein
LDAARANHFPPVGLISFQGTPIFSWEIRVLNRLNHLR